MGKILTSVPFFSDEIRIKAHSATHAVHVERPVSIREFADNQRVGLEQVDNGDYVCSRADGAFIEGPEA